MNDTITTEAAQQELDRITPNINESNWFALYDDVLRGLANRTIPDIDSVSLSGGMATWESTRQEIRVAMELRNFAKDMLGPDISAEVSKIPIGKNFLNWLMPDVGREPAKQRLLADSDGDGLNDPEELETHHTDPNVADSDNNGLRDGEEFTNYHTNPLASDTDGDGFLDGYEVLTGKLPLDPLVKPALVAEARTAIEFTFPAAIGKTYRIEASTDLGEWSTVEAGIVGQGTQVQRFYSTLGQQKRYFRVEEAGQ